MSWPSLTLRSSGPMPKLKTNMVEPRKRRFYLTESDSDTDNSLNCLAGLWTFLHLKDVKISLHIIVLIVRGCFDRTHGLNKLFFALDARALLMLNYNKPSRIFPCTLLTRNHMIFLVQFGINKYLLIFSKTTNCTHPTGSCNFVSL